MPDSVPGGSTIKAPLPTPPVRQFSFTNVSTNTPTAQQPGDRMDAEYDRSNAATTELIDFVAVTFNTDGSLVPGSVGLAQLDPSIVADITAQIDAELQPLVDDAQAYAVSADISASAAAAAESTVTNSAAAAAASASTASAASVTAQQASAAAQGYATTASNAQAAAANAANDTDEDVALAQDYALVTQAWAEHMPDTIPPNILAVMNITGDHWSSRWWANKAAGAFGELASLYMGALPHPPLSTPTGDPIPVGGIYYDTTTQQPYVWTGTQWQPFWAPTKALTLTLVYSATANQTVFNTTTRDLAGNNWTFSSPNPEPVEVFVSGDRLAGSENSYVGAWTLNPTANTVTFGSPIPLNSLVIIDILTPASELAPSAVTTQQLLPFNINPSTGNPGQIDGVKTTFPLALANRSPLTVNTALELFIIVDGIPQQPGIDFVPSSGGTTITFSEAPELGSVAWGLWFTGTNPGTPGAGIYLPMSGGTMTGNLTYTATGGNTLRSLQSRAGETLSATDFGIICDGVTDQGAQLNAALASMAPGTTLFIPGSIYTTQTIMVSSGRRLEMPPGNLVRPTTGSNLLVGTIAIIGSSTLSPVVQVGGAGAAGNEGGLTNVWITRNGTPAAGSIGLQVYGQDQYFTRCRFYNHARGTMVGGSQSNPAPNSAITTAFDHCIWWNCTEDFTYLQCAPETTFINCRWGINGSLDPSGATSLVTIDGDNNLNSAAATNTLTFLRCQFNTGGMPLYSVRFVGSGYGGGVFKLIGCYSGGASIAFCYIDPTCTFVQGLTLIGCTFGPLASGETFIAGKYAALNALKILGCEFSPVTPASFYLSGTSAIIVGNNWFGGSVVQLDSMTGGTFAGNNANTLQFTGTYSSSPFVVSGNSFTNITQTATGTINFVEPAGNYGNQLLLGKAGQAGRVDFRRGSDGQPLAWVGVAGATGGALVELVNTGGSPVVALDAQNVGGAISLRSNAVEKLNVGSNGVTFSAPVIGTYGNQLVIGQLGQSGRIDFIRGLDGQSYSWIGGTAPGGAGALTINSFGGSQTITLNNGNSGYTVFQTNGAENGRFDVNGLGLSKVTASAVTPGAGLAKLAFIPGTSPGTAKLVAYAGTSLTPTTIADNIGAGF